VRATQRDTTMTSYFGRRAISHMRKVARHILRNADGSAAMLFGVAAVPMMAAAGLAVDYNRVLDAKSAMQSMADRAAIFGAAFDGTLAQKKTAAEDFATHNPIDMNGLTYTTPTVVADAVAVKIDFTAQVETTLFGIMKVAADGGANEGNSASSSGGMQLPIKSRARYQAGSVKNVCILALAPTAPKAIDLRGTGDVIADNCGVHSDSNALDSIYANGNAFLGANFIHAVGGVEQASVSQTNYSVTPVEGQTVFGDPFASKTSMWATINSSSGCGTTTATNGTATGNSLAAATTLSLSKYNNITINSNKFGKLTQSVVYVFGTLDVKGTLNTNTTGATIVLCGANAKITMGAQGAFKVKAPTNSPPSDFAGFAVIGNYAATAESTLRGGGDTEFIGMWYTPSGAVSTGGTSDFNSNSKYFPIVAARVYTFGTANVNIQNDWAYYGYPDRPELKLVVDKKVWLADY
jgi:Flp pilus assembly protein TadG/polyisoprenoid-binding protein YceI